MRFTLASVVVLFLVTFCRGTPENFNDLEDEKALNEVLDMIIDKDRRMFNEMNERNGENEIDHAGLLEKRGLESDIAKQLNKIKNAYKSAASKQQFLKAGRQALASVFKGKDLNAVKNGIKAYY